MPLGLGLQYASLTASQRALVARRYDRSINSSSGPLPPVPPSPDTATGGRGSPLSLPRGEMPRSAVVASSSPPSGEPVALRLSQVDRDVLECLPIEMREEVLRAVGAVASKNEVHAPPSHDNASFSMKNAPSCEENVASPEINAASPEGINERDLIVVDLRTPGSPSLDLTELSQVDGDDDNDHATCGSRRHPRRRQRHVFEAESVGTLRAALRAWVGGSVRSPSEWHLELLYRLGVLDLTWKGGDKGCWTQRRTYVCSVTICCQIGRTFRVCMYVWSSHIAEYGSTGKGCQSCPWSVEQGKIIIPLCPCVPEDLVSRDGFSRPVPRQPAHSPYSG